MALPDDMVAEAARLTGRAAAYKQEGQTFMAERLTAAAANLSHAARQLHTIAAREREMTTTGETTI